MKIKLHANRGSADKCQASANLLVYLVKARLRHENVMNLYTVHVLMGSCRKVNIPLSVIGVCLQVC